MSDFKIDLVDWSHPRGSDTSRALAEVRTVLSRAETALSKLSDGVTEYRYDRNTDSTDGRDEWRDEDADEMVFDLEQVVTLLEKWRKTGATKRGEW